MSDSGGPHHGGRRQSFWKYLSGCWRSGLSQADFAARFGFERDTVQNWEQGRNAPDMPTRVLLSIIERQPDLVEAALTGWPDD